MEREQQIRQAALLLAGQCIALLLHSLSQSRSAHSTAAKQTQGWRLPTSTGDGKRRVQVLTLGNVVVPLWLPYVVERSPRQDAKPGIKRQKPLMSGVLPIFEMVEHGRPHHSFSLVYPRPVRDAECV